MDQREHFLAVVDYEKWANEQWLQFFEEAVLQPQGAQFMAKAEPIMEHIIGCYWRWFKVMSGENEDLVGDLRLDLAAQYTKMREFIASSDLDVKVRRSWEEYGTYEFAAWQIVQHALNHGSFHRGQIRALAEEHGFEEWPETDFGDLVAVKIS